MGLTDPLKTVMILLSSCQRLKRKTTMTYYIQVPKNNVPQSLQEEIISKLPAPRQQPGQRFTGFEFRNINLIKTKNLVTGATDNPARAAGTGESKEELITSLAKGILPEKYPPSLYDERLKDGFNRHRDLVKLGYTFWVFAIYEYDPDSRTRFQSDAEDALRDGRLSLNRDLGKKPATDDDYVSEASDRIQKGSLLPVKADIIEWINTIEHNFSIRKVSGISNKIISSYKRQGKIEYYSREEAEQLITNIDSTALTVNTKDKTRVLRVWKQIMENFITTKETVPVVPFSSGAVTHQGWDDEMEEFVKSLVEMEEITLKYAAAKMLYNKKSYVIPGALDQKIQPGQLLNKTSFIFIK